jgi:hypothetical protein
MTVSLDALISGLDEIDPDDVDAYRAALAHMAQLYPGAGDEVVQRLQARGEASRDRLVRAGARLLAEQILDEMKNHGEFIAVAPGRIVEAEAFFAQRGWQPASCLLANATGRRKRRSGYVRKGLFIHCVEGQGWAVTHVGTGHKITGFAPVIGEAAEMAIAFAEAIAGLVDWEQIGSVEAWEKVSTPALLAAIRQTAEAVTASTGLPS